MNRHAIALLLPLAVLTGCRHHDAIVFATSTQLGVRVGVSAQQVPEIQVGFNRQEGALVPLYLSTPDDRAGPHHPVIAGLLAQAQTLLEQASATSDANWKTEGRQNAKSASAIISSSLAYNKNADQSVASSLLVDIEAKAKAIADKDTKPAIDDFAVLRAMIATEIKKPSLLAQFDKDAKYIGEIKGGNRKDAYSVIAILDASGTGNSTNSAQKTETTGKIAQYFATGIAAQSLADKGASVVGGAVEQSANSKAIDDIINKGISAQNLFDQAADTIWNVAPAEREAITAKILGGVNLRPAKGEDAASITKAISKKSTRKEIRDAISEYDDPVSVVQINGNLRKL